MREKKFKAWNKEQNRMYSWEELMSFGYNERWFVENTNKNYINCIFTDNDLILIQYIGNDPIGNEIYEGSIAHVIEAGDYGGEFYGKIEWLPRWCIYGIACVEIKEISKSKTNKRVDTIFTHGFLTRPHGSCIDLCDAVNFEKFEIIGNIYEHPELLEDKG